MSSLLKRLQPDEIQSTYKWRIVDHFFAWLERSKLKNRNFSIISNNCFAGGIYHKFGLQYNTPTIWTYIFPEEYIRLLENLPFYLSQPLQFTAETKHPLACTLNGLMPRDYPIGVLGGDVEIHFMHYETEQEALEKWTQRLQRLNLSNLFIIFSLDRGWLETATMTETLKEELLERYERLPYPHKIFLSPQPQVKYKSTVFVKDCANAPYIYDYTRNRKYEKYVDLIKWFNGEENFLKTKEAKPHELQR